MEEVSNKVTELIKESSILILEEEILNLKSELNKLKSENEEREKRNKCEVVDSSYTLKLGQTPKLIYVSQDGRGSSDILYIDGKIVQGVVSFNLFSSIDEVTRHTVEYNTCQAK